MAELTEHFGLTRLAPGESLSANGYAFIGGNIDTIDRVLVLARDHNHTGAAAAVTDPDTAPSLVLDSVSGNIPSGTTVYYRYTYVDEFGAETAGSPDASVTTPSPIAEPTGPALSSITTGGSNQGGQYRYSMTAYAGPDTSETKLGARRAIALPYSVATHTVTITFPTLPVNADGFNIYRRGPGEAQFTFLTTIDMTIATPPVDFIDDGTTSGSNPNRIPPGQNLTFGSNNIDVSLPGATPTVPANVTWKVYRTYVTNNWKASNLHHVVEETFEGSGIIDPTFLDLGQGTGLQVVPELTEVVPQPSQVDLQDAAEVQGIAPPGVLAPPYDVTFTHAGTLSPTTGEIVWRCPFDYAEIVECAATLGVASTPDATDVIIDIHKWDSAAATPSWGTIYTTQANRPEVLVANTIGVATIPDVTTLVKDDMLVMDIDQAGGGSNTDENLSVVVYMYIRSTTTTSPNVP